MPRRSWEILGTMQIKIKNTSHHPLPKYETSQSAGMDLRAFLPEGPITLKPMERGLVKTGLFMELPAGHEAQVRPRSGLALKKGITVLNSPGLSQEDFVINDGERIAQMVIARHEQAEILQVEELSDTERGTGGFGHTGKK